MFAYQRFSRQIWIALALASSACGSSTLNQGKLAEAQAAMHAAETLGAVRDPKAKQSLDQARDAVSKAKRMSEDGDGEEANMYLRRAIADADVASQLMRTRSEQEKASASVARSMAASTGAPMQR